MDFEFTHRDTVITHLEEYYGKDHVAHIGAYGTMGVKSGIKDITRVLGIPYKVSDEISKAIDTIKVKPQPKFKDYDDLKDSANPTERSMWETFNNLEKKYPEIFRLARAFEGSPRSFGVHASGILVTPMPIDDLVPTRVDSSTGVTVTLFTGPQVEAQNLVKCDILGLRNLSVIQQALAHIDKNMTFEDLYKKVNLNDSNLYQYLAEGNTEGTFQLESNLMKSVLRKIEATSFDDIVATNAIARPGPISVHMDDQYASVKKGLTPPNYPIRGVENLLDETYSTILYQETLMAISKQVSGFDDNQADSIVRKIIAKKKVKLFPMLIRCHIYGKKNCEGPEGWEEDNNAPWYDPKGKYGGEIKGALANGYTAEELKHYFDTIAGFSSYCFNLSHACCYSYISMLTAWLKYYYPVEFMAALLSMCKEEQRKLYIDICERKLGIQIVTPNINESEESFTPDVKNKVILYGLGSIKGVGATSIPDILANRPYASLKDALERIPKKSFNKRVAVGLIEAGAFDFEDKNRYKILNQLFDLRKDKDERYNEDDYNDEVCIEMERNRMGMSLTHKSWWDSLEAGDHVEVQAKIEKVSEVKDKKGGLMAFAEITANKCLIKATIFASRYCNMVGVFNNKANKNIIIAGKKQEDYKKAGEYVLIVNKASAC